MSVGTVITEGFGTFGSVSFVVTQGYGDYGGVIPPVVDDGGPGRGASRPYKKGRKSKLIKASDLEALAAYQLPAIPIRQPLTDVPPGQEIITDEDEELDALILKTLTVILH